MIFWEDAKGKVYWKSEICDSYLKNIAKALLEGKGSLSFLSEAKIDAIFEECAERSILSYEEAHKKSEEAIEIWIDRRDRFHINLDEGESLWFWQEERL